MSIEILEGLAYLWLNFETVSVILFLTPDSRPMMGHQTLSGDIFGRGKEGGKQVASCILQIETLRISPSLVVIFVAISRSVGVIEVSRMHNICFRFTPDSLVNRYLYVIHLSSVK